MTCFRTDIRAFLSRLSGLCPKVRTLPLRIVPAVSGLVIFLSVIPADAQVHSWTLQECISYAFEHNITLKQQNIQVLQQEVELSTAKGSRLPQVSASGGIGTNYYTMSSAPSNSFFEQMKNNFSQFLGLSLSVPVFSGFQSRNQVRSARLNRTYQELQLERVKKSLYKEIQQTYYNAVAAGEKYSSCLESRQSAKKSYDLVTAKYEIGKANITEFNEARDNFLESESNLVCSRYEYLFSAKLLDFYAGKPLML